MAQRSVKEIYPSGGVTDSSAANNIWKTLFFFKISACNHFPYHLYMSVQSNLVIVPSFSTSPARCKEGKQTF